MAKDLGFGGIEVRGLGEDIFAVTPGRLPMNSYPKPWRNYAL